MFDCGYRQAQTGLGQTFSNGEQVSNNEHNSAQIINDGYSNYSMETPSSLQIPEPMQEDQDCFRVVRTSKRMEFPCTRNEYRRYKVKVPREVSKTVPRRVQYTDYETKSRVEPYTVKRFETAFRDEDQQYTVQVPKKVTKMVKVVKKVPKTVYVDVVSEVPQEQIVMVPETRTRRVKVPYSKEVVEQQYRTVQDTIPVTKYRTEYDTISETVYDDSWKTECVPVTKMVHKEIPVFEVLPKPGGECGNCDQIESNIGLPMGYESQPIGQYQHTDYIAPSSYDTNNDGVFDANETAGSYDDGHLITEGYPVETYNPPVEYDYSNNGVLDPNVIQNAANNMDPGTLQLEQAPMIKEAPSENIVPPYTNEAQQVSPEPKEVTPVKQEAPPAEKWVKTQYSAPAGYDTNNNGVLDANEREAARSDGNLHVDSIAVVRNSEEGDEVIEQEQIYARPRSQGRRRRKKSSGRRRRRKSRR